MQIKKKLKSTAWYKKFKRSRSAIRYVKSGKQDVSHYSKLVLYCRLLGAVIFRDVRPAEFFYLHFMDHSWKERRQFLTANERVKLLWTLNPEQERDISRSKKRMYEVFKDFYKRDACAIGKDEVGTEYAVNKLKSFLQNNKSFISKPLMSYRGLGIRIFHEGEFSIDAIDTLFEEYPDGFLLEELITQSEFTAKFHPKSVNTLRVYTMRYESEVEVLWPCFRFGRGDSVVDNAASGGVVMALDPITGVSIGAADEAGVFYTKHPEYDFPLIGCKFPMWKEACEKVKEMAMVIPTSGCRFIGWDLALTDTGWIMVELNASPEIGSQIVLSKGVRSDFERIVKRFKAESRISASNK